MASCEQEPSTDIDLRSKQSSINFATAMKNGQRKYGGPPKNWIGPPPSKGSEVFVWKIPRDILEDVLLPLFETVAPIYEMRLMMDFNGSNRGFGFFTYANPTDAAKAIQQLNNYEIRPKRFIGVIRSLDNCRLFVGGIPKDKTEEDIRLEMSRLTDGIVRVILYSSVTDKSKNRGFAFIEYESHRAAAVARRKCVPNRLELWGKAVVVDWAEPEPMVDESVLSKVRILYVRNLITTTKEEELERLFNAASANGVEKVKILDDFAFVHFATREQAQRALESLHNTEVNGVKMQITWAKPVTDKKRHQMQKTLAKGMPPLTVPPANWPNFNFNPYSLPPHLAYQVYSQYPLFSPNQRQLNSLLLPPTRPDRMLANLIRNERRLGLPPSHQPHDQRKVQHKPPATGFYQESERPWSNGGFSNYIEDLKVICELHNIGEPLFEVCKCGDDGYLAKVAIPNLGPPCNAFQTVETYEREEEARQVIAGYAVHYLNQALPSHGVNALNSQLGNFSLNDTTELIKSSAGFLPTV